MCLKVDKHRGTNNFLLNILHSAEFRCDDCENDFVLKVYKTHKASGLCQKKAKPMEDFDVEMNDNMSGENIIFG